MKTVYGGAVALLVVAGLVFGYVAFADEEKKEQAGFIQLTPEDLKWEDAGAPLPAGVKSARLEGDSKKEGPYTLRLKIPAGTKVAPHTHGAAEHVTVISGTFHLGQGEKFDEAKGKALAAGSFFVVPAKAPHYGWTTADTVIQLHGIGPQSMTYCNPEDHPKK